MNLFAQDIDGGRETQLYTYNGWSLNFSLASGAMFQTVLGCALCKGSGYSNAYYFMQK